MGFISGMIMVIGCLSLDQCFCRMYEPHILCTGSAYAGSATVSMVCPCSVLGIHIQHAQVRNAQGCCSHGFQLALGENNFPKYRSCWGLSYLIPRLNPHTFWGVDQQSKEKCALSSLRPSLIGAVRYRPGQRVGPSPTTCKGHSVPNSIKRWAPGILLAFLSSLFTLLWTESGVKGLLQLPPFIRIPLILTIQNTKMQQQHKKKITKKRQLRDGFSPEALPTQWSWACAI